MIDMKIIKIQIKKMNILHENMFVKNKYGHQQEKNVVQKNENITYVTEENGMKSAI